MYKIINWYTKHFRFPHRGWKFVRAFLKRTGLFNRTYTRKLHNGSLIYVNPSEHIQQQLFWYGYYEKEAILTWEALIQPGDIVLDVGANIGYYSLIAAPKAKTVYAFEPASPIRALLEKNLSLNRFTNVSVQAMALSNEEGKTDLYISSADNTGMTGLQPAENFSGSKELVSTITVDQWVNTHDVKKISIIKIDAEGAEGNILSGMSIILQEQKPVIFIEVIAPLLKKFGQTPSALFDLLLSRRYKAYEPVKPAVLRVLTEPKEADTVIFLPEGYKLPGSIVLAD